MKTFKLILLISTITLNASSKKKTSPSKAHFVITAYVTNYIKGFPEEKFSGKKFASSLEEAVKSKLSPQAAVEGLPSSMTAHRDYDAPQVSFRHEVSVEGGTQEEQRKLRAHPQSLNKE